MAKNSMAKISMANTMIDHRAETSPARAEAPPLSANVRRHLGQSLRTFYAPALSEPVPSPVSERLDALLAKLEAKA